MFFDPIIKFFFPKICSYCDILLEKNDEFLCLDCLGNLTIITHEKLFKQELHKLFCNQKTFQEAKALFLFEKNSTSQELIHQLKYKKMPEISNYLGIWMGNELKKWDNSNKIDMVTNVPIHPIRWIERGYNQVDGFAREISQILEVPYQKKILKKTKYHQKASKSNKQTREKNLKNSFRLKCTDKIELKGKHILIVDDVITTGQTLQHCLEVLSKIPDVRISIVCMAFNAQIK